MKALRFKTQIRQAFFDFTPRSKNAYKLIQKTESKKVVLLTTSSSGKMSHSLYNQRIIIVEWGAK